MIECRLLPLNVNSFFDFRWESGIESFTSNILPILKDEEPNLISVITVTLTKVANPLLRDNRKRAKVR